MDIGRIDGAQGPGRIEPRKVQPNQSTPIQPASAPADRVEISRTGQLVSDAMALPEMRMDRVAALKQQIEAGTYQTDERLLGAIDRFMDELKGR